MSYSTHRVETIHATDYDIQLSTFHFMNLKFIVAHWMGTLSERGSAHVYYR